MTVELGDIARLAAELVDVGEWIGNSCIHCFVLGWEASKQYG